MSTFEEIVSAIRSLPLPEREEGRLLIVKAHCTYPAEMFDHRAIREERLDKLATGT